MEEPIDFDTVPWPSAEDPEGFADFLRCIDHLMRRQPQEETDGATLDEERLRRDYEYFMNDKCTKTREARLAELVRRRQGELPAGLKARHVEGFEAYPKYDKLYDMATYGLRPFLREDFRPNRGEGDFARVPQYRRLKPVIIKHLRKLKTKDGL